MDNPRLQRWVHDLANSLAAVLGYLELHATGRQRDKKYEAARVGMDRALALIRELQQEMKGESGSLVLVPPEARNDLITSMIEDAGLPVQKDLAQCQQICPRTSARYLVDLRALRRVVDNIVGNAVKAGATQMTFQTSCEVLTGDRPCCLVSLTDNGSGMTRWRLESLGVIYEGEDGMPHGRGVQVIRTLCAEMGIAVHWNSILGLGTEVTLIWPKVQAGDQTDQGGSAV